MNITKVVESCKCGNSMSRDVFTERTNVACRVCGELYDVVVQHCETCGTRRSGILQRGASFPTFCEKCKPQPVKDSFAYYSENRKAHKLLAEKESKRPFLFGNPYYILGTWIGTMVFLLLSTRPETAVALGGVQLIVMLLLYKRHHKQ